MSNRDTWWMLSDENLCPQCDDGLKSNGRVHSCVSCGWEEVIYD